MYYHVIRGSLVFEEVILSGANSAAVWGFGSYPQTLRGFTATRIQDEMHGIDA